MKIVITGNMGYVGPLVVGRLRLVLPTATLVGIDTAYFGHCLASVTPLPEHAVDIQYFADVRDVGEDVLQGANALVQLAAISNDPMGSAYEMVTDEVNHKASIRLALAAKNAGVRSMVFTSSCSVYGYAEGEARDENSEINPLTAYAKSKINTELSVKELADKNFVVTCLRFPTACGMSSRLRLDLVVNDFVASALAMNRIDIFSDGTPWRPLIDVKDMARAIEWAVGRRPESGGAFLAINVGRDDCNYRVREIAALVQKELPRVRISINHDAQPDKRSYRVDFTRYRSLAPDHLPEVSLTHSIRELIDGLKEIGFNDVNFRSSKFIRLKELNALRESRVLDRSLRWKDR